MPTKRNTNFYDMGAMSYKESTSQKISEFARENLRVGIPALVVGVGDYESLQCVDVQPVIEDVYTKNNSIKLSANIIKKVFVLLPSTGGFSIKQPVTKGDIVTLFWSHKDLGAWLDSEGTSQVEQSVFRVANLEDCWVELKGGTRKNHTSPSLNNLVIEGAETTITITPSGEVSITTTGTSTVTSSGHTVNADTQINGTLTVRDSISSPTVTADTSLTIDGKEIKDHTHPYSWTDPAGSGNTGGNT